MSPVNWKQCCSEREMPETLNETDVHSGPEKHHMTISMEMLQDRPQKE